MNERWKRQALCAGSLLAAGLLGSGCVGNWENEESSGGSFKERRVAQLRAQSFESYGDGRLPQEMKLASQQATGGSGGGALAPAASQAPAQGTQATPGGPAQTPGKRTPPKQQPQQQPRGDSGASPEKG